MPLFRRVLHRLQEDTLLAILLDAFTDDWLLLAWGVSVGGFGLGIGPLANLIAIRLARGEARWTEFHKWSITLLIAGTAVAFGLIFFLM